MLQGLARVGAARWPAGAAVAATALRLVPRTAAVVGCGAFDGDSHGPLPVGVRGIRTQPTTRRRKKEIRKQAAAHMRSLLTVAQLYDPMRTAFWELAQTIDRLGWYFNLREMISDGVVVDFAMKEHYCAFHVVDAKHYVPAGHPDASTIPAMPPLARNYAGEIVMPHESSHPFAPPPWDNPVLGLYLDKETAAYKRLVEGKGWALISIPLPLWQLARAMRKQHYARRDVLLQLTLPRVPFESRPVSRTIDTRAVKAPAQGEKDGAPRLLADMSTRSRASRSALRMAQSAAAAAAAGVPRRRKTVAKAAQQRGSAAERRGAGVFNEADFDDVDEEEAPAESEKADRARA